MINRRSVGLVEKFSNTHGRVETHDYGLAGGALGLLLVVAMVLVLAVVTTEQLQRKRW